MRPFFLLYVSGEIFSIDFVSVGIVQLWHNHVPQGNTVKKEQSHETDFFKKADIVRNLYSRIA